MATAATVQSCTEPATTECSICNQPFTVPKLLLCDHVLCRHCLLSWLQSNPHAQCPLCRFPIVDPGQTRARQDWAVVADGFPTDLAMVELIDAERLLNNLHRCCFCDQAPATSQCWDCGDMYCNSCKKGHTKQKMSQHHHVRDLSSLTADQLSFGRSWPCPARADKACEQYCPDHDLAMCRGTDLQHSVVESDQRLEAMAAQLGAAERELSAAIQQLDQRQQAALNELRVACDRLKAAIDNGYQRVQCQAEAASCDDNNEVQDEKACLLQRRGRVTSQSRLVKRVREMKNAEARRSMTSIVEKRMNYLGLSTTLPHRAKVISEVSVKIDNAAVERLERELLELLGQVQNVPAEPSIKRMSAVLLQTVREWHFHDNHGTNIRLTNGQRTAKKTGKDAMVVGKEPMVVDILYEVRVDKKGVDYTYLLMGVTTAAPATLFLPSWCGEDKEPWRTSAVVIYCDFVMKFGNEVNSTIGQGLLSLEEDSRVGVLVDKCRNLHLYINGQDQRVVVPDIPHPCYPFFDLCMDVHQVTALSVSTIDV